MRVKSHRKMSINMFVDACIYAMEAREEAGGGGKGEEERGRRRVVRFKGLSILFV